MTGYQLPQKPQQPSLRTLRLTFEYEGERVRLVARQSVAKRTPSPSLTPIRQGQSGFWYELRDQSGSVLYQRALHNPIRFDAEVFSNDPNEPAIRRTPRVNPRGVFELLVPEIDEGIEVVAFSSPLRADAAMGPATELFRVALAEPNDRAVQQQTGSDQSKIDEEA